MAGMRKRRAVIIGGSLGGLFAAHELRAIGWDVDVFERTADDLADRGAGIGTHRPLFEIMRRAGLRLDPEADGTAPRSYICLDRDNRLDSRADHAPDHDGLVAALPPAQGPSARGQLPPAKSLERIEADDTGATAIFADGSRAIGDLLIGADGFRSTVRAQLLPDVKPSYSGYVGWRALVPQDDLPAATWAAIHDRYVFCVPEGELLVSYPVPTRGSDAHRGRLSYNIVWYRPADEAELADLCTDAPRKPARVLDRPAADPAGGGGGHEGRRPRAAGAAHRRRHRVSRAALLPADL